MTTNKKKTRTRKPKEDDGDYSKYNLEQIESKIETLEGTLKFLYEEMRPIEEKIERLNALKERAVEKRSSLKYDVFGDNAEDGKPLTKAEIDFILIADHHSMRAYEIAEKVVYNKLTLRRSGYWPESNQAAFQLCFYKGDKEKFDKTVEDINLLFPYLIETNTKINDFRSPVKNITGIKFSVFEHSLSANGIYQYIMENHGKSNAKYYLIKTTYGRTEIKKEFNDFVDSLKYIEDNHYYEWPDKPQNDYDDDEEY